MATDEADGRSDRSCDEGPIVAACRAEYDPGGGGGLTA